jgi:hypothetical protein
MLGSPFRSWSGRPVECRIVAEMGESGDRRGSSRATAGDRSGRSPGEPGRDRQSNGLETRRERRDRGRLRDAVVVETGQTDIVVNDPSRAHARTGSRSLRRGMLDEDAGVTRAVGEQVLERVRVPVGRERRGRQEREQVDSGEPAQAAGIQGTKQRQGARAHSVSSIQRFRRAGHNLFRNEVVARSLPEMRWLALKPWGRRLLEAHEVLLGSIRLTGQIIIMAFPSQNKGAKVLRSWHAG